MQYIWERDKDFSTLSAGTLKTSVFFHNTKLSITQKNFKEICQLTKIPRFHQKIPSNKLDIFSAKIQIRHFGRYFFKKVVFARIFNLDFVILQFVQDISFCNAVRLWLLCNFCSTKKLIRKRLGTLCQARLRFWDYIS